MQYRHEIPLSKIQLHLFPTTQKTSFQLYEDDGISFKYLDGDFALTNITLQDLGKHIAVNIDFAPKSEVKEWELVLALPNGPKNVICNGQTLSASWDEARQELHCTLI